VKYSSKGRVFRESTGTVNLAEAQRFLKRRLGEVVTGKFGGLTPERIRFCDLAEGVIHDYIDNERASLGHVKRRLKLHLLPTLGDVRAGEFTTDHVKRYVAERRRRGASNANINRELAIVKRGFRLAFQCDPPKVMRIPYIPKLEENNVRTGFLEHDGYVQLRDALPGPVRPLFVVAYHVGPRRGELLVLQWPQVDLVAQRIRLEPGTTKNKEGRTLPIYGEMLEWLRMQKQIRDTKFPHCPFVFHRGGKPIKDFRKAWATACERTGLDGLLFHDLRRTAVRNMVRAGTPERVAMQISGHKTRSIFDRYNIVSDRDLTEAALKMEHHFERTGILSGIPAESDTGSPTQTKDPRGEVTLYN